MKGPEKPQIKTVVWRAFWIQLFFFSIFLFSAQIYARTPKVVYCNTNYDCYKTGALDATKGWLCKQDGRLNKKICKQPCKSSEKPVMARYKGSGRIRCMTRHKACHKQSHHATFQVYYFVPVRDKESKSRNDFPRYLCKTKPGHFYNAKEDKYAICDKDGDSWLNVDAFGAYENMTRGGRWLYTAAVKENYRCKILKIEHFIYRKVLREYDKSIVVKDKKGRTIKKGGWIYKTQNRSIFPKKGAVRISIPMIESNKNDGLAGKLPVYPVISSDGKNKQTTKLKPFNPKQVNTLTKICKSKYTDLNSNGMLDYEENKVISNPELFKKVKEHSMIKELARWAFFLELAYGKIKRRAIRKKSTSVVERVTYIITERERDPDSMLGAKGQSKFNRTLGLTCTGQSKKNLYWRKCRLKDDQKCGEKRGLSYCKNPKIKHALPSLFKCVLIGSKERRGYFTSYLAGRPGEVDKVFSYMNKCTLLNGKVPNFSCTLSSKKPKDGDLGWVCLNYQGHYKDPKKYFSGCVQECTENNFRYKKDKGTKKQVAEAEYNLVCPGFPILGGLMCGTDVANYGKGICKDYHYGEFVTLSPQRVCTPKSSKSQFCLSQSSLARDLARSKRYIATQGKSGYLLLIGPSTTGIPTCTEGSAMCSCRTIKKKSQKSRCDKHLKCRYDKCTPCPEGSKGCKCNMALPKGLRCRKKLKCNTNGVCG